MTYNAKHQDDFYNLFEGNPNAFGVDTDAGVRCVRGSAYDAVGRHLDGGPPCGIYPMNGNTVKWGCTDIDNGSLEDAQTMADILGRMQMFPWIEQSRSKGYHVWVFSAEWVPAWVMRRMFLFAHHVSTQIGKPVPPTEVNPKSEWLDDDQLGNFVRVPYVNGGPDENGRRIMLSYPSVGDWLPCVNEVADPQRIREWASRYSPPKSQFSMGDTEISESAAALAGRLTGLGYKIFTEGPPEWNPRRSNTMAKLARECAISGLSPDEAYVIISDLDNRLEKWTGRSPEGTERARRTCVEWGYNNV